jgi:hypothetical protein
MKRFIFTLKTIALSAILFSSQFAKAQTPTLTVLNNDCNTANWTDNRNFDDASNSTLEFFGAGWYKTMNGSDGYLELSANTASTYDLTSPTYRFTNSTVLLSFAIGGSSQVSSLAIYVESNTSPTPVLLGTLQGQVGGKYCLQISNFNNYVNQRSRFIFVFTTSNNGQSGAGLISFDDWATNFAVAEAPLPVSFVGIEAKKVSNGTQITWKVAQEENVLNYSLERSVDGKIFTSVGTTSANGGTSYSLTDNQVSSSAVYYRVRNNDKDGRFKYSTTVKVEGGKISFLKRAYPMPAVSEVFIQHDAAAAGAVITLTAQDGRVVKKITTQTGSMQTRIDVLGLNAGMYFVRYDDGTGSAETLKVVKQ